MKALYFLILLFPVYGYSQTISVNDTGNSPFALAEFLLDNACVEISNASFSSGKSVATFDNNGGNFPLAEGVIIRSGKAKYSEGIYTGENMSSQENELSDPALEEISAESGSSFITDVAFLQFDFVPLSHNFSFNFLFASNEYGQWQCFSSDAFAFLLTNLETGITTNLAVIPNTSIPVSVANIHDQAYNQSCSSQHPNLFGVYNVDNPQNSTLNMRGTTKVMNASASIEPGTSYRLRLVIGDSNDADFDSAIFIESGSFETSIDLGEDQTICAGDSIQLQTGLDPTVYAHTWKRNGQIIPNENNSTLTVTQTGTYEVIVTKNGINCTISDEINFNELTVQSPEDLSVCNSGSEAYFYNLSQNDVNELNINGDIYEVFYYSSQENIDDNMPIPNNELTDYQSAGNETIYIKIFNSSSGHFCDAQYSFELLVDSQIEAYPPDPIEFCYSSSGYIVDLTEVEDQVLGGQDDELEVSYFPDEISSEVGTNPIENPASHSLSPGFSILTFWARVENSEDPDCYNIVDFQVIENPLPEVSNLPDTIVCAEGDFVFPQIDNGEYYSDSHASGTHYLPGESVTEDGRYYIHSGPDANGCQNESSFKVTILEHYDVSGTYCDHFTIPSPPAGHFYTEIDGPDGNGELIDPGTVLTTSQTIYYYAEINGDLCKNEPFDIIVHPLPPVDAPSDVVTCQTYTLPQLENGNYFSDSDGQGTSYSAGDMITSSMTMYVYADDGICTNETNFHITIIPDFEEVIACGSYILPELEAGGYYTEPGGQGAEIPSGTEITETQTIYVYAETTETPNCTNDLSFEVKVFPIPPVDSLEDVFLCENESYTLPNIENGEYFTESDRQGEQLEPGNSITETQDIYINSANKYCSDETVFTVTINPFPPVTNYTDVYSCGPYTYELPNPEYGKVYTEPDGEGHQVENGEVFNTTTMLYIYNESTEKPYCSSQEEFTIYVIDIPDIGDFENIAACDHYTLPSLSVGKYFTKPHGKGEEMYANTVIDSSQTIYVYAENGDRFTCKSEDDFDIVISETPELPEFEDVEKCESYTLPPLNFTDYHTDYYLAPNGQSKITEANYRLDPGTYTIYVRASALNNPDCTDEKQFTVTVYPLPKMDIPSTTICVNPNTGETLDPAYIDSGVDDSIYQVEWYLDGELMHTGHDYEAYKAGIYVVKATNANIGDAINCDFKPAHVIVRESSMPVAEAHVNEDFSDQTSITVDIIKGFGDYVYQLDDTPFQTDNVFRNVNSGAHIIRVKDPYGVCGMDILEVEVLKYPKFFTPNNDGQNDRWNIKTLANHPETEIYIFDRYGKLLKQIYPNGEGWDGTFNGKRMPSNDYWFKATYKRDHQKKVFTSHFTLIR